jgi:hypothetical protein
MAQLRLIEPSFLLLFGGVAVSAWVQGYRVGEIRGRWVKCPISGLDVDTWGLVTWHPAAVLRNQALLIDVLDDLRVFHESVEGGSETRPPIPPYVYRPCVKCGSCVGTHITDEGIAWCQKHWEWKTGKSGKGKVVGRPAKRGKKMKLF